MLHVCSGKVVSLLLGVSTDYIHGRRRTPHTCREFAVDYKVREKGRT